MAERIKRTSYVKALRVPRLDWYGLMDRRLRPLVGEEPDMETGDKLSKPWGFALSDVEEKTIITESERLCNPRRVVRTGSYAAQIAGGAVRMDYERADDWVAQLDDVVETADMGISRKSARRRWSSIGLSEDLALVTIAMERPDTNSLRVFVGPMRDDAEAKARRLLADD